MSAALASMADRKYPFRKHEVFGRLLTLNGDFAKRECVRDVMERLLKPNGIELVGRLGKRDQLIAVSFEGIPDVLPLDREVLARFAARGSADLQVGVLWFPPEVYESFESPRARMELSLGFPKGWDFRAAEYLFRDAVQLLMPHWGELNQLAATEFPTLCTLSGHHYCVPHLGTANYFGPEYCDFFGGVERIQSAGFDRVSPLGEGVLASLGLDLPAADYRRLRGEVEGRLAPPETFDPNAMIDLPHFRR
jgi:hypothetical protein